ncbi:MAG: histidinol phosphate phosphatase domain-containing protein [Candidatus Omnitrophica bacterium]|nr:histidinol phosphate phosphatase domain-containing protein [Candidatus Omnitrophota bacterium]
MIDLHTHSLLSDGVLLPAELIRRAESIGYKAIGITDHADSSNIDFVLPRILKICKKLSGKLDIKIIPGVELTHILPEEFLELVKYARNNGACLVVGHGQTLAEPVRPKTNRLAIEAGVDILAHPGLIEIEDAKLAAQKGVCLEISARNGHCLTNGHVAKTALEVNATLVINTDTHMPENLITKEQALLIGRAAGLEEDYIKENIFRKSEKMVARLLERLK